MIDVALDDRISLKLLEPSHGEALFALADASREQLRRWLPWVDGMRTVEAAASGIEVWAMQFEVGRAMMLGVFDGEDFAGVVGFQTIDWQARCATLEYWLGPAYEGRGIVTRACALLIARALEDMGLNRVELRVEPANERSKAVARRLGFQLEGRLRQAAQLNGEFVDHEVWGLLACDRAAASEPA